MSIMSLYSGSTSYVCPTHSQDLVLSNADEYAMLVKDFCLKTGIKKQLDAFKGTYMYFTCTCTCGHMHVCHSGCGRSILVGQTISPRQQWCGLPPHD